MIRRIAHLYSRLSEHPLADRGSLPETTSAEGDIISGDVDSQGGKPPGVTIFDDEISNITFTDAGLHFKGVADSSPLRINYFESNNVYLYIHGKEDPQGDWWRSRNGQDTFSGRGGVLVNCHFDS